MAQCINAFHDSTLHLRRPLTGRWGSLIVNKFMSTTIDTRAVCATTIAMLKSSLQSGHNGCFRLPSYSHLYCHIRRSYWPCIVVTYTASENSVHNKELLNWTFKPSRVHASQFGYWKIFSYTTDQHYCILTLWKYPLDKIHATAQYILTICKVWVVRNTYTVW